jgi:carbon monoxide dehydrogenase subunit G
MRLEKTIPIACTPARLWTCLTDPETIKRWLDDLVDETPEDPAKTTGVGAVSTMRIREGGKIQSYRSVITAWEPDRRVALQMTGGSFGQGMAMDIDYRITPEAQGCRLDYAVEIPLKGMFILMAPMLWLFSRMNAHKALGKLAKVASEE